MWTSIVALARIPKLALRRFGDLLEFALPATIFISLTGSTLWFGFVAYRHDEMLRAAAYFVCSIIIIVAAIRLWLDAAKSRSAPIPQFQVVYEVPGEPARREKWSSWTLGLLVLTQITGAGWQYLNSALLVLPLAFPYDRLATPYGKRRIFILFGILGAVAIESGVQRHAFAISLPQTLIALLAASVVPLAWPQSRSREFVIGTVTSVVLSLALFYALKPFVWTVSESIAIGIGLLAALAAWRPKPTVTAYERLKAAAPPGVTFSTDEERDYVYFTGPVETALEFDLAGEYDFARRRFEPNSIAATVHELKGTGAGLRCPIRDPDALLSRLAAQSRRSLSRCDYCNAGTEIQ